MKRSSVFRPVVTGSRAACLFASAIAALLATTAVQAATLYWDLNQDTANDAGPLTGTWDGINVYWNSDSSGTGGTPTATTTAADDLVFSSGSVYTAGTVTTEGSQAASSLTFKDNIAVTLAGTLVQNATPVSADNATDTFSYTGTAVQDGEVVSFGGTPPAGLIAGQIYYIINSTAGTYQVANTAGGAAIDFTDDGDSVTNTVQTTLALGGSGTYKGIIVSAGNSTISAPVSLTANISYTFQVAAGASLTQSGSVTTPGGGATDTQINKTGTGTMNFTGGMFSSSSTGVRRLQVSEGIANFTNSNVYLSHFGKGSSNNAYITATNSSINLSYLGSWWQQFYIGQGGGVTSYAMHGGTMSVGNSQLNLMGYNGNGKAIMSLDDSAAVDVMWTWMGEDNNSLGILVVRDATFNCTEEIQAGGAKGAGVINQLAGTVTSGLYLGFQYRMNQATSWGIYNLAGGTLTCPEIRSGDGTANYVQNNTYFNFHGGTLTPTAASTNFIRTTITGANAALAAPRALVYSEGAVIDTDVNNITIQQPLAAPAGSGVDGTTLGIDTPDQGAGYRSAPVITISRGAGDTTGAAATAIANMVDDGLGNGTFKLASITITNPGVNYTEVPTLVVSGGDPTTAAVLPALTISPNISGGLTKKGSGTLTLGGNNTYTGDTTVTEGTLVLADNARLKFAVTNTTSNRITGVSTSIATLEGDFVIDTSAVTASSGTWNLVDVDNLDENFTSNFTVFESGVDWFESGGIWTKTDGTKTWTFNQATGDLTLTSSAAASYADWAGEFAGPPLSPTAADADPDNDGLKNAVEYVLGTDPRFSNQSGIASSLVGTDLVLTFNRKDTSETADVALTVEVSTDLTDWTTLPGYSIGATTATSTTPGVDVEEAGPDDTDIITVTIPMAPHATKFARLNVTITP